MYHPTAGHWVLGEILATVTGLDHADAIEELVTAPLGLPRLLAIPVDQQGDIVDAVGVGAPPTPEEMEEAFGFKVDIAALIPPDVALHALLSLNDPEARAVGVPGGGGIFRARTWPCCTKGSCTIRRTCGPARSWPRAPSVCA